MKKSTAYFNTRQKDSPYVYKYFVEQFYKAYLLLKEKYPSPIYLFFVKAFLLGRIIELIFKTELILKGCDPRILKKRDVAGHDLIKLLTLLGFPEDYIISPGCYDAINHLNDYYCEKKYEYPELGNVEIQDIALLEGFIHLSLSKVTFGLKNKNKSN